MIMQVSYNILSLISVIRRPKKSCLLESSVSMSTSNSSTMVDHKDINRYFEIAKDLTLEAGKLIKNVTKTLVELKTGHNDLVTEFDNKVENMLIDGLSKEFPNHKFIGEETTDIEKGIPELTDDPTWIIDPIDGTSNFIHSYPEFCISIGLTIHKELVIGIIYNPVSCHLYTAKKNEGAFLNDVKIEPSNVTELKNALVSTEAALVNEKMKNRDLYAGRIEALATLTQGIRSNGSAALSLAYIARGIIDIYQMQLLKPWDVAAGVLIIQEAGGVVTDFKGQPFNFMQVNLGIIAAPNEQLVKEVAKLIIDTDLKTQRKRLKRT